MASKLISALSESSTATNKRSSQQDDDDVPLPQVSTIMKLEEIATSKLAEIVRQFGGKKKGWSGYDEAEVIAARELLDRDAKTER